MWETGIPPDGSNPNWDWEELAWLYYVPAWHAVSLLKRLVFAFRTKITMATPNMKILMWQAANRGTMTKIAERAKVTPQFVYLVIRGRRKSKGGKVERLLKEAGAPI